MEFTEDEIEAFNKLMDAYVSFCALPAQNPFDVNEFKEAIQRAQLLILARPGKRFINTNHNVSKMHIKKTG